MGRQGGRRDINEELKSRYHSPPIDIETCSRNHIGDEPAFVRYDSYEDLTARRASTLCNMEGEEVTSTEALN